MGLAGEQERAPAASTTTPTSGEPSAMRRWAWGYLLLLPALIFVGVVIIYPVVSAIVGSVTDSGSLVAGEGQTSFVGVKHYRTMFADPVFWTSFKNNLIILVSIPLRIVLGLLIVQVLYKGIFASKWYQTVIFLPFIAPIAGIGIIFIYVLNQSGPFNAFLRVIGLGGLSTGWLTNQAVTMWTIMGVVLWTRLGFTVLLFMVRLLGVDRQVFQAAFVDGATWREAFWRIGVPELKGTIEFVALLGFIEAFSWSFAYVFVLAQGAFRTSSWILEIYLYDRGFRGLTTGVASAVAVFLFLLAGLVALYRYRRAKLELV
jgi:ABC-type sugar transport system permease subunit